DASAIHGFRNSEAVGVVRHSHLSPESRREVEVQAAADQPCRIGVLDQPSGGRQRAGYADADRSRRPGAFLQHEYQMAYRRERGFVVARGRLDAQARPLASVVVQRDPLYLGPAEVNADSHGPSYASLGLADVIG